MDEKEILKNATDQCNKWVKALDFSGKKTNVKKIKEILSKRTYNGEPVTAYVVKSKDEVFDVIKDLYDKATPSNKEVLKQSHMCIWDYYLMAFYESTCAQLPNKDFEQAEFIYQSLLPAFEHGLGYLVLLGPVIIGVCLPEAYCDERQNIHSETGPAIIWGDEKQYWWHGTKVPAEWIEDKESVDPSLALTHPNIEERRALCEILGWGNVISQLNPTVIDTDSDPQIGELLQVDIPDAGRESFLKVLCGTGRTFVLPVPSEMKTALQANAWTYGIEEPISITDFKSEVRT